MSASTSTASFRKHRRLLILSILLLLGGLIWWVRQGPAELDLYKAQLLAQGEVLDLDKLAPKRTGNEPDGQEPLRKAEQQITLQTPHGIRLHIGMVLPETDTNTLLHIDWWTHSKATNQALRAPLWQSLEAEIASRRAELVLLHQALQNPAAEKGADYRLHLNYPKPSLVRLRLVAQFLSPAVIADVHARRPAEAADSMTALLNQCALYREERSLVVQMIRVAITGLTISTLHYGLETHTWQESDLARFQTQLENVSLVTNLHHALLYERAQGIRSFAESRQSVDLMSSNLNYGSSMDLEERLRMRYWINFDAERDELGYLRCTQSQLDILRRQRESQAWTGVMEEMGTIPENLRFQRKGWLGQNSILLSDALTANLSKAIRTVAVNETRRQQAIVAIALERHRLKQGSYPDTLEKLIPDYLTRIPQDPMDGHPLRYRLNTNGTFTLWSVGLDGKDEQGNPFIPPTNDPYHYDARDLVWPRLDPIDLPPR